MSYACFGPGHSPFFNYWWCAPDATAVGTILTSLVMTQCLAEIPIYHHFPSFLGLIFKFIRRFQSTKTQKFLNHSEYIKFSKSNHLKIVHIFFSEMNILTFGHKLWLNKKTIKKNSLWKPWFKFNVFGFNWTWF